jgi:hypothetical protein
MFVLTNEGTILGFGSSDIDYDKLRYLRNVKLLSPEFALTNEGKLVSLIRNSPIAEKTDVKMLFFSTGLYAALKNNGDVDAFARFGYPLADLAVVGEHLKNVIFIVSRKNKFAALTTDHKIVMWGDNYFNGPGNFEKVEKLMIETIKKKFPQIDLNKLIYIKRT